jgi:hypothetical protein
MEKGWIARCNVTRDKLWLAMKYIPKYGHIVSSHKRFNVMLRKIREKELFHDKYGFYPETSEAYHPMALSLDTSSAKSFTEII